MPNEFEKLVQQKMDELKLVPSEPVWQKVEMQIRKKNDRRRLIFWIPFLGLLLGGGLWIGMNQYSKQVSYNKSNNPINKATDKNPDRNSPTTPTTNNSTPTTKPIQKKSSESAKTIINSNRLQNEKTKKLTESKNTDTGLSDEPGVQKSFSKKIRKEKEFGVVSKKESPQKPEEAGLNRPAKNEVAVTQSSPEQKLKQTISSLDIAVKTDTTKAFSVDEKKIEPTISVPDSIKENTVSEKDSIQKQDTAAVKKTNIKKYAASKWKLNLIASAGSSNNTDFDLFSGVFGGGEKSLSAPNYNVGSSPGTVTGGFVNYGPSSVKRGFSFAIGAVEKKQIAQRALFSAGLRYNYYSNTIQVGNKINQNRVFMDFSVSQYYSNTATSLQPYRNQYHFVSVPLAIDWQVLKRLPLNFSTGLSLQYLFKTNGLVFDYSNQSYFNSKDAFNRLQLFFEPALTYSVSIKQKVLTFGPQLQYGLTRLEKNTSGYHLTSFGLKAQLQLGKK